MGGYVQPDKLNYGDIVSPLFNPSLTVEFSRTAVSTLGEALPAGERNPNLDPSTPVRLVWGYRTGWATEETRLLLEAGDDIYLIRRVNGGDYG